MNETQETAEPVGGPNQVGTQREERMRRFVAALRSGQFPQATGALQRMEYDDDDAGGFCCLGVACEVAIADGLQLSKEALPDPARPVHSSKLYMHYGEEMSLLPDVVQQWYGLIDDNPDLNVPTETGDEAGNEAFQERWQEDPHVRFVAAELNDDYGFALAQIADCFECTFLPEDWEVTRATRG